MTKNLKREDFDRILSLYPKQPWLTDKEDILIELIQTCEKPELKNLIVDLLANFVYIEQKLLNKYLDLISHYIIKDTGFNELETQIASITIDDDADSSQKVLDYVKVPLFKAGWSHVKTVNKFGKITEHHKKGKTNIILIDEFIGSGKTIVGRIKNLKSNIKGDFNLKLCFIAGMDYAIRRIEDMGYDVFCPVRLRRGITDSFPGKDLENTIVKMHIIEMKLAKLINEHDLEDYSFGYNNAQALYSLEACLGNTPNSVFPIFWWPRYANNGSRKTLLTRVEKGLK